MSGEAQSILTLWLTLWSRSWQATSRNPNAHDFWQHAQDSKASFDGSKTLDAEGLGLGPVAGAGF